MGIYTFSCGGYIMTDKKLKINTDVVLCGVGNNVKAIDSMIHLIKPHPSPICIMTSKTSGIEPTFNMKYIRGIKDETPKDCQGAIDFRRIVRKITNT